MTGRTTIELPTADGGLERFAFSGRHVVGRSEPARSRTAFAAAHAVADEQGGVDWDATIAYRRHLWSRGLGVAEAMDTAQRGSGLAPDDVGELIARSLAAAADTGGALAVGMATDRLPAGPADLPDVIHAYVDQLALLAGTSAVPVLMASRQLAAAAGGPDDYRHVYDAVLAQVERPVLLHWLGEVFDPQLAGYWGSSDTAVAIDHVVELLGDHTDRVAGIKISLLDAEAEIELRRRLPMGVDCYTGDDFDYPRLIAGDGHHHSHALLGIFDVIADAASAALAALDDGDVAGFHAVLDPTVPLSRRLFEAPTYHYKTGVVFLAHLRGHQDRFRMLGGHETDRDIVHLADLVRLGDAAGLFADPDDAARRLEPLLERAGVR